MRENPYEAARIPADPSKRNWDRINFILGWALVLVLSFTFALVVALIGVFVES